MVPVCPSTHACHFRFREPGEVPELTTVTGDPGTGPGHRPRARHFYSHFLVVLDLNHALIIFCMQIQATL